jgi:hypothetical protein
MERFYFMTEIKERALKAGDNIENVKCVEWI